MPKKPKIDMFTIDELKEIVENSASQREVLSKLGYGQSGASYKTLKDRCKKYNISLEHFQTDGRSMSTPITLKDFCENSTRATKNIKNFILKNNLLLYKCQCCGNTGQWLDKELILQLDHINGNNTDNRLENLRFLCPNCHSQTDTWGRNKDS